MMCYSAGKFGALKKIFSVALFGFREANTKIVQLQFFTIFNVRIFSRRMRDGTYFQKATENGTIILHTFSE